jgi:HEPN domain-containing protein
MGKKALDPLKMFVHAERFRFTDRYLRSPKVMSNDPRVGSYIVAPTLVLSAFASELYLKCLLCLNAFAVPTTHNLKNLFGRLPRKDRRRIEEM